jgi:hypothetical protein
VDEIVCNCREFLEDMANNWTCPVHGRMEFWSEDSKLEALYSMIYDPVVERINELTKEIGRTG